LTFEQITHLLWFIGIWKRLKYSSKWRTQTFVENGWSFNLHIVLRQLNTSAVHLCNISFALLFLVINKVIWELSCNTLYIWFGYSCPIYLFFEKTETKRSKTTQGTAPQAVSFPGNGSLPHHENANKTRFSETPISNFAFFC